MKRWAPFLVFAAFVVALSALFYQEWFRDWLPAIVGRLDKILHFALSGGLAFTFDRALAHKDWRKIPVAPVLLLTVMAIEEYLQRFSVTRTSSFGDYAADVVGVSFFTWLARRVGSKPGLPDTRDDVAK